MGRNNLVSHDIRPPPASAEIDAVVFLVGRAQSIPSFVSPRGG